MACLAISVIGSRRRVAGRKDGKQQKYSAKKRETDIVKEPNPTQRKPIFVVRYVERDLARVDGRTRRPGRLGHRSGRGDGTEVCRKLSELPSQPRWAGHRRLHVRHCRAAVQIARGKTRCLYREESSKVR